MVTHDRATRRSVLASVLMAAGLLASYGLLALQGLLFIVPERLGPRKRRLFAGQADQFEVGVVRPIHDLRGNEILLRRGADGFSAFSSRCPHLGCRVHWQTAEQRFFCPCHNGVFDADGVAVSGPPADAGQRLAPVPFTVDTASGVIYVEVDDVGGARSRARS